MRTASVISLFCLLSYFFLIAEAYSSFLYLLTSPQFRLNKLKNRPCGKYFRMKLSTASTLDTDVGSNSLIATSNTFVGETAKVIVSGTAGIVLISHSASWKPLYYITGAVINAIFSKVLKNILKIPRPVESGENGYGMPSSHSQSLFYFFSVLSSLLLLDSASFPSYIIVLLIGIYAVAASLWRVSTKLHTIDQTLVGATTGFAVEQCFLYLEKFVIYKKGTSMPGNLSLFFSVTSQNVPFILRFGICLIGAYVLFKREFTTWKQSKTSKVL